MTLRPNHDAATAMKTRLRADLSAAMKARRLDETRLLRALIAALDNAEAVPVAEARDGHLARPPGDPAVEAPRRELSAAEILGLIAHEAADRRAAAVDLERLGRADEALRLRAEAELTERYL